MIAAEHVPHHARYTRSHQPRLDTGDLAVGARKTIAPGSPSDGLGRHRGVASPGAPCLVLGAMAWHLTPTLCGISPAPTGRLTRRR
jgi:hypothetical protein